jgi:acetyl esterase/lipase
VSRDILDLPAPTADERIPYGDDPLQFGDLRLPAGSGPHPVVAFLHGGFWRAQYDLTHAGHLCAALTETGIATWNIEYRRIGNPGGGWPGTFHDVAQALDILRELSSRYDLDLARVMTAGHSAGGHLAFWLGARHRIPAESSILSRDPLPLRGSLALAGVVDLRAAWELRLRDGIVRELMGGTPDEVPERYHAASPAELLPFGTPQVLIHGTEDESVPYGIAVEYYRRAIALGDPVSLITLEGSGHFGVIDPLSVDWAAVKDAVSRLL